MLGLWLLVPEHLRLGTWDVVCNWAQQPTERVEPRLALQLVHEAALCVTGIRQARHLSQRGFELLNGLPFTASDQSIHDLLEMHTVANAEALQVQLGLLRRARQPVVVLRRHIVNAASARPIHDIILNIVSNLCFVGADIL